ncbi:MAG: prepilin-type N-terminal cleavage/methylation domain-containing protein, partial [Proteobacteria bacterium]|nr:prepilin-type N-terminal cleavage/methylation domain-containing protein [Pseudomonadota bacterium]
MNIFSNRLLPAIRYFLACKQSRASGRLRVLVAPHPGTHQSSTPHRPGTHHPSTPHPFGPHPSGPHRPGAHYPSSPHRLGLRRLDRQRVGGFTLIEVLLATGLSTLLVVAAYSIFSNNQVTARKNAWRFAFEDSARFSLEV